MATQVKLSAERREERGKGSARKLRAAGKLPAVVYGADADPLALTLSAHDAELLFRSISVDNTIINLEVQGNSVPVPTLVREVQVHPVRPGLVHVDFLRIQTGVEVEVEIPVHLAGTPKGVKDDGGVLEQTIHHIPEEFLVDVSALEVGDSLHLGEVGVPEGVEILLDAERTVCSVQAPTRLEVEDEVDEEGEPELVGEADEGEDAEAAESDDEEGAEG